jgi:hypothetical protein
MKDGQSDLQVLDGFASEKDPAPSVHWIQRMGEGMIRSWPSITLWDLSSSLGTCRSSFPEPASYTHIREVA